MTDWLIETPKNIVEDERGYAASTVAEQAKIVPAELEASAFHTPKESG